MPEGAPAVPDAGASLETGREAEVGEGVGTPEASVEAAETVAVTTPARSTRSTRATRTTRTTRTTKAAAEEAAPTPPEPAAAVDEAGESGAAAPPEAPEQLDKPTARRRTRRRTAEERSSEQEPEEAVAPPSAEEIDELRDEPLDGESPGEDLDEDDELDSDLTERPRLLSDPFGFAASESLAAPAPLFQASSSVFTPLFQPPDPFRAEPSRPAREERPQVVLREPEPEAAEELDEDDHEADGEGEEYGSRRRRRRRGGRGRGRARDRDEAAEDELDEESEPVAAQEASAGEAEEAEGEDETDESEQEAVGSRRRRRRRRRGGDDGLEPAADDPPNTVVRIRAPRVGRVTSVDEVQSVRGSTRLEAKKQRRREGRELGRRRPPIITESEFLARRESVERVMVVRRYGGRTQIAVLEDGVLVEHYVDRESSQSYVGNVYLGKVQNVLPSMEAAFIDIGKGRNAVLYAGEVNFDTAGLEGQPKRIESALKSGQSVLVQVTKDPMGHKGARLTSQISLPGRYLVYVPDGSMTGISRKLPDKERTRLKSILRKVMPENAGVIVRTAAEGASEEELSRDVARLSAQWENIQRKTRSASPPELLYSEPDLTVRVVRDVFNEDFSSLVVQGSEAWATVDEYVRYVAPHLADRLTRWEDDGDVFAAYRVDEQIAKALERKVWLPSGGSLVIDRTEAMTVVDVNTGKFTGQGGNLEETVTRNNLEAAEEIVRQLRLRDIGGIIVIDFIDMVLESNRDLVLRRLLECLARDRTKHQVAEVTSLGLVQMTRKRVGQGLLEAFSTACECCNGRGLILSTEPVEGKPEPRGTQGKMAVEKAVSEKVSAATDQGGRDTVTGALGDVSDEDSRAEQISGRGRRRSRRAKSVD
nr:Rne/Rng family ribonuclease [Sinosporangium album]